MDSLQWFKFNPSKWVMGRIQKCPEITQARFIRLCCIYWSKSCNMSIEDAEIEVDKDQLKILVDKKVIVLMDDCIYIDFLSEQLNVLSNIIVDQSEKGKIGNLKRWHPDIYKRFKDKEITLNDALLIIAKQSQPDRPPIDTRSLIIADKIREDKKREEDIIEETHSLVVDVIKYLNTKCNKNFKSKTGSTKKAINARAKEGYTIEDFKKVIDIKSTKWGNDPKMSDYLRPETLFSPKFESYLNEVAPTNQISTKNAHLFQS